MAAEKGGEDGEGSLAAMGVGPTYPDNSMCSEIRLHICSEVRQQICHSMYSEIRLHIYSGIDHPMYGVNSRRQDKDALMSLACACPPTSSQKRYFDIRFSKVNSHTHPST